MSSEGGNAEERKVSEGTEMCGGLVQLAAAVDNEDLQGAVVSFRSLLWHLLFAVVIGEELFLIALGDGKHRIETEAV